MCDKGDGTYGERLKKGDRLRMEDKRPFVSPIRETL